MFDGRPIDGIHEARYLGQRLSGMVDGIAERGAQRPERRDEAHVVGGGS